MEITKIEMRAAHRGSFVVVAADGFLNCGRRHDQHTVVVANRGWAALFLPDIRRNDGFDQVHQFLGPFLFGLQLLRIGAGIPGPVEQLIGSAALADAAGSAATAAAQFP